MGKYFTQTIVALSIILFSIMYSSCGKKNDCWVCEGYGKNKCIVCLDEKTEMIGCSFCDSSGEVICTICNGTGNMKN